MAMGYNGVPLRSRMTRLFDFQGTKGPISLFEFIRHSVEIKPTCWGQWLETISRWDIEVVGTVYWRLQEGASIEFTNKALRGDYDFTTCVKTTVPGAIAHNEMYFGNTTDTSAITEDTTTTKDLPD